MSEGNLALASRISQLVRLPSRRDLCGESDPRRGEGKGGQRPVHLSLLSCRTSGKNMGVALTTFSPPVRRSVAPGEGGDAQGPASLRVPATDAGNPCCPASGAAFRGSPPTTTARAPPSERKALWVSKSCHPSMSPPPSERVTPIRRHLLDPQRRKSSIIPRPLDTGHSCASSFITLRTALRLP